MYSYLSEPLTQSAETYFQGHSNKWESREIAMIFTRLGFEVDAVEWTERDIPIDGPYDIVFDIYVNQQYWASQTAGALKLLHLTGSDWRYQNGAELRRVRELEARRGGTYMPRRIVPLSDLMDRALHLANQCSLVGNSHTLSTYPDTFRSKIVPVGVTASTSFMKTPSELVPPEREFLWFFGGGLVHKGLDLVLEVFRACPELKLNVVGNVHAERDFLSIYRHELFECPNIQVHGYLAPDDARFASIVRRCAFFIAPSCSEGISPAAATCMQAGLYPILSRDTGITLPDGVGQYLETCSIDEITNAVVLAKDIPAKSLRDMIAESQRNALDCYSRSRFTERMTLYLQDVLA